LITPARWNQIQRELEVAIALESVERAEYLENLGTNDPDLREELESLLAQESAIGFLETSLTGLLSEENVGPDPMIGCRLGPYQIVEQIGAGGMGEVYRAIRADDQYKKQVAIKLVRAGRRSAQILSRFRNERQILASLDHPNIARLLDGGMGPEATPYLVMDLIDGQPIDEYCDNRNLTITSRLKLFLEVCSAVGYAHRRLIVHRDLKPGNILVTAEGIPKLLDFGIAKILDSGAVEGLEATATVLRILTPRYASPEQIQGETITTLSDVYSLGVVLYELLTGHHPYRVPSRTPDALSRAVCEFAPERPSAVVLRTGTLETNKPELTPATVSAVREGSPEKLRKRLSGDLDNIVLMALRKEPERRYASVEQLGEDIRRHLGDLPVIARKDTVGYRASKFIVRHKTAVVAAVLVTLMLLTALAVTIREARIAQQRFDDVRSLANSLIFDIHDSIQDLPGATPARKLIVEKALQYLDRLALESRGDRSLQRELAAGYKRIGDVQGYPYSANLGDTPGARKSYEKALAIRQSLFASNPDNVEDAVGLAESLQLVAEILLVNSDGKKALEYSQRAVHVSEQADRAHPNNLRVLKELAADYETEANILGGNFNLANLGDSSAALALRRKQLEIAERVVAILPGDIAARRQVAVALTGLGDQLLLDGRRRQALAYARQALTIFEELANTSESTKTLEDLDATYSRVMTLDTGNGDYQDAAAIDRRALEVSKKLNLIDPSNTKAKLGLSVDYANVADTASRLGQRGEAVSAINRAIDMVNELVKQSPNNTEFRGFQAALDSAAGDVFRRSEDVAHSLFLYREALATIVQIQYDDPTNVDARLRHAAIRNSVADMLTRSRDLESASEMYNEALALANAEATSSHPNEQALYSTADSYTGLAAIKAALAADTSVAREKRIELWTEASSLAEHSLGIWAEIKEPGVLSPDGFDCVPPSVVAQRLATYREALASLEARRSTPLIR
jgi:serine/threonine protein kinase/tetratricopeptide (TPR) repeat protein